MVTTKINRKPNCFLLQNKLGDVSGGFVCSCHARSGIALSASRFVLRAFLSASSLAIGYLTYLYSMSSFSDSCFSSCSWLHRWQQHPSDSKEKTQGLESAVQTQLLALHAVVCCPLCWVLQSLLSDPMQQIWRNNYQTFFCHHFTGFIWK